MGRVEARQQRPASGKLCLAGGKKIATASPWQSVWVHEDPVKGSRPDAEFTADGINVGFAEPTQPAPEFHDTKFMEVGGSSNCYVGNPNCVTCFLDSLEVDCGHVAHLLDAGAAKPCPDNDCGPHQQTVDALDGNGHVVRSSSRWVLPGQAGWDGSLDGLYRISRDGPHVFVDIISGGRYRYALDDVWLHSQTTPQKTAESLPLDLNNIRRGLAWYLVNPDCASFIEELLNQTATGENPRVRNEGRDADILDVFDIVRSGIVRGTPIGGGQAVGSVGEGHPGVLMGPTIFGGSPTMSEKASIELGMDIHVLLHELIHLSGSNHYSDYQLAVSVATMTGTQVPPPTGRGLISDTFAYSNFWDNELRKHCKDFKVK